MAQPSPAVGLPLKALAPKQSEPPFLVAQLIVMALFIVLGVYAVKGFHPEISHKSAATA